MAFAITQERIDKAEELRQRYIRNAYRTECRTGKAPEAIVSPRSVQEAVKHLTGMDDEDASAAALAIERDPHQPLSQFLEVLPGLSEAAVNYVFSSVSYRYFAIKYMSDYFFRPFSELYHDPYFSILRAVETHSVDTPVVVAGPRDWGKTAIGGVLLPVHSIIFPCMIYYPNGQKKDIGKRFIAIIAAALSNAQRLLGSICGVLEDNETIRKDFGEFYRDPDKRPGQRDKPWSRTVAVTTNDKRLEAFSRGSKIRGAFWKGTRPDLGIGDDLEDDEAVEQSSLVRNRNYRWMVNTLVNCFAKENGNLLMLGNLTHPDGLIARLVTHAREHGWLHRVFRVHEKDEETGDTVYLWESDFGPEFEKDKRQVITDEGFELEYQMNPEAYERDLTHSDISYYTMDDIRDRLHQLAVYAAIDPASTVSRRSDNTAAIAIAYDELTKITYVLPKAFIGKIPVKEQAELVIRMAGRWDPVEFGIEDAAYQTALHERVTELSEEEGLTVVTRPMKQASGITKIRRIIHRLYGRTENGKILFVLGDPTHQVIIDELINVHNPGVKDDAADALEMAVRLKDEEFILKTRRHSGIRARAIYNTPQFGEDLEKLANARANEAVRRMQDPMYEMTQAVEQGRRDGAAYRRQNATARCSFARVMGIRPGPG